LSRVLSESVNVSHSSAPEQSKPDCELTSLTELSDTAGDELLAVDSELADDALLAVDSELKPTDDSLLDSLLNPPDD